MPKTLAECAALLQQAMFRRWLEESGLGPEGWGAFAHGIPLEWARMFEQLTNGALRVEDWPRVIHPPKLHGRTVNTKTRRVVNINTPTMEQSQAHRVAISAKRTKDSKDKFFAAIRKRGYTMNSLAEAIEVKPPLLSMYRSGTRPIPMVRAKRVEALTGWKADASHWPRLLAE
jgi:hypothetical protein